MQNKWETLKKQMMELDASLDEVQADKKNQQLRASISNMISNDRSTLDSLNDTPGSSPASSVVMTGMTGGLDATTPIKNGKLRTGSKSGLPQPGGRRNSSLPSSQLPRKGLGNRLSTYGPSSSHTSPSPTPR